MKQCYCSSASYTPPKIFHTQWGEVHVACCHQCGLARDVIEYDREGYYTETTDDWFKITPSEFHARVTQMRPYIGFLTKAKLRPGRALDVGCNGGYLACALQQAGWDCEGLEVSRPACEFARKQGINVFNGTLEKFAASANTSYDLITVSHVLEHVVDLKSFFQSLVSLLRPKGHLFIAVPNYGSLPVRWLNYARGSIFLPVQHIWYFTAPSLERTVSQFGFSQVGLTTYTSPNTESELPFGSALKSALKWWMNRLEQGEELLALFQYR